MQWLTVGLGIQPCTTHKVWVKRLLLLALTPDPNIDRMATEWRDHVGTRCRKVIGHWLRGRHFQIEWSNGVNMTSNMKPCEPSKRGRPLLDSL